MLLALLFSFLSVSVERQRSMFVERPAQGRGEASQLMTIETNLSHDLNKAAAPDGILCVGAGKTAYVGRLGQVDWHQHGAPVFIAGLAGKFRLATPDGAWLSCGAAVIPAGVRHALDVGDDPLAVFYPEPNVATVTDLVRFGALWDATGRILVARTATLGPFRALYEDRDTLSFAGEMLDDLVQFLRAGSAPPPLDPRIARVIEWLGRNPADLTALDELVRSDGLSVSRFLHVFSEEMGVPFRRFRIWNRLRAASSMALRGANLTEAAINAGFSDSAHFSRLHRDTFGVTPSYILGRLARATISARGERAARGR
jgi:AraC-like DNA-binding protein